MDEILDFISRTCLFFEDRPWLAAAFGLSGLKLIDVSPMKIYPFRWIRGLIVKGLKNVVSEANEETNKTIADKFNDINNKLEDLGTEMVSIKEDLALYRSEQETAQREQLKTRAKELRGKILHFADQVYDGKLPQRKTWEYILFDALEEYHNIIEELEMENSQTDASAEFLLKEYYKHLDAHDFPLDKQ